MIVAVILVAGAVIGLAALAVLAVELLGHIRRFQHSMAGVQTGLVLPARALSDAFAQAQRERAATADVPAATAPDTVAGAKTAVQRQRPRGSRSPIS